MGLYYSKDGLYREVENLKDFLGVGRMCYGFDLVQTLLRRGFLLQSVPFQTKGLRGMAIIGDAKQDDVILLNCKRSQEEQNFDCGHEMIHLALHRCLNQKTFNCFDKLQANQNPFIEWQANEGAAEFFVPYQVFLPMIKRCFAYLNTYRNIEKFKKEMADTFHVPEAVINYRIENLKYETEQYLSGVPLDKLEILSAKKQCERNIQVQSLNDISNSDLSRQFETCKLSFTV